MSATVDLFQYMAAHYDTGFLTAVNSDVGSALSAVRAPLSAALVIWVIVLGYMMMTGGVDLRYGMSKVVTMAIVVGLVTSTTNYDKYIENFFLYDIPGFIGSTFGTTTVGGIPKQLDNIMVQFLIMGTALIKKAGCYFCVLKPTLTAIEVVVVAIVFMLGLGIVFAVYLITHTLIGLLVVLGPFMLIGLLFEKTKHIPENWLGKLVGLMILLLLLTVVLSTFTNGLLGYLNNITAAKSTAEVAKQGVLVLVELTTYVVIIAFLTLMLPGIASYIGGGISMDISNVANPTNWKGPSEWLN